LNINMLSIFGSTASSPLAPVDVPQKVSDDAKAVKPKVDLVRAAGLMKGQLQRSKGKQITVKLVQKQTFSTASATAYNTVLALSPIGVQDWTSFASLYDIARVKSLVIHQKLTSGAANQGGQTWAIAFDPANAGAYAGVADVLTAAHNSGPIPFEDNLSTPSAVTRNGFLKWGLKFPEQKMRITDDATSSSIGGGWFATESTSLVTGYLKPYVEAVTGTTSIVVLWIEYWCVFAMRT